MCWLNGEDEVIGTLLASLLAVVLLNGFEILALVLVVFFCWLHYLCIICCVCTVLTLSSFSRD